MSDFNPLGGRLAIAPGSNVATITGCDIGLLKEGMDLYIGSRTRKLGASYKIASTVPSGTNGGTVTLYDAYDGPSAVSNAAFIVATIGLLETDPLFLPSQLVRTISSMQELLGPSASLDGNSRLVRLRKRNAAAVGEISFETEDGGQHFGIDMPEGDPSTFRLFTKAPGTSPRKFALTLDRTTGTADFLSGETAVASAATVDLGGIRTRRVFISGTNAITSFGAYANKERIVRFESTLTINVAGLPSIRTTAGDVAYIAFDVNGLPRLVAYRRGSSRNLFDVTMVMGNTGTATAPAGSTRYLTHAVMEGAAPIVYQPVPLAGRFHSLRVILPDLVPSGQSLIFTLQKLFSDTELTCRIGAGGSASNIGVDLDHVVLFEASERWCLKVVASAGASIPANIAFSMVYESTE